MNFEISFNRKAVVFIALNVITGLCAVYMIERMVPVIKGIVTDNAESIDAASDLMEIVALSTGEERNLALEELFNSALAKATANATVEGESQALEEIKRHAGRFFSDQRSSRDALIAAIAELIQLNQLAVRTSNISAQQLGWAGGWAIGIVTFISTLMQLYLINRLRQATIEPAQELCSALDDYRRGNLLRRVHFLKATQEMKDLAAAMNELMEYSMQGKRRP